MSWYFRMIQIASGSIYTTSPPEGHSHTEGGRGGTTNTTSHLKSLDYTDSMMCVTRGSPWWASEDEGHSTLFSQGQTEGTMTRILKTLLYSTSTISKVLSKFTRVFIVFLRFQGQIEEVSTLITGELLLETLLITVALENSSGERAKRF